MRFTDDEIQLMITELSGTSEFARVIPRGQYELSEEDEKRADLFDSVLGKLHAEQGRRATKVIQDATKKINETMRSKGMSKWDRLKPGTAMDALMEKINEARQEQAQGEGGGQ